MSSSHFIPSLSDREAIADAIYRYMDGIDDNDAALTGCAFTEDAVFDLSDFGDPNAVLNGRKAITDHIARTVGPMDTLHQMTNQRIWVDAAAGTAKVSAAALAQHKRTGEGRDPGGEELLMGSRMLIDAVKVRDEDGGWLIKRFVLKNFWGRGTTAVMPFLKK